MCTAYAPNWACAEGVQCSGLILPFSVKCYKPARVSNVRGFPFKTGLTVRETIIFFTEQVNYIRLY